MPADLHDVASAEPAEDGWSTRRILHTRSHAVLLGRSRIARTATVNSYPITVDAIIVPTHRPPAHLNAAIKLAALLNCHLLVLYTNHCPQDMPAHLTQVQPGQVSTIVIPQNYQHDMLDFLTANHPHGVSTAHFDISRKRNLGLLIARMCGWRRVFFLDDDIRDIVPAQILTAANALADHSVAGLKITSFPDNSVVCHAYRLAGGSQDTFIGGNALMVDPTRENSFFPPIYNEDWLFMADHVRKRSAMIAGFARQLPYEPFSHPKRAYSEEFGDILAEGLYTIFHDGAEIGDADLAFWRDALVRRSRLLEMIGSKLFSVYGIAEVEPALLALAAAARRLSELSALDFVSFLRAWQRDRIKWQDTIWQLPIQGAVADAAKYLLLSETDFNDNKRPLNTRHYRLGGADSFDWMQVPAYPRRTSGRG